MPGAASTLLDGTSPIYNSLIRQQLYESEFLKIKMTQPDVFEKLYTRLGQRDPAKGCLDPAVLTSPDGRDFAEITLALPDGGGSKLVRLPAFWAHLVDPATLWDTENSDPVAHDGVEVFSEGTWSGGLLWDASVVATELLLQSPDWQASVRGATCLELGSGLGLPGLACALLGARNALVTDRPAVARLVEDAIKINGLADVASAVSFEWDAQGAKGLLDRIGGSFPDVIIACDCIFAPLFGDSFLLLDVLLMLSGEGTRVLVSSERRPEDGIDRFFESARERGFETNDACAMRAGVWAVEMRLRPSRSD